MEGPFTVAGHSTVRGQLGFTGGSLRGGNDPFPWLHEAKLRVVDHLSGQDVRIDLFNGRYPPKERP